MSENLETILRPRAANHPHAAVWEVLAQCWVDTEYDGGDLDRFAAQLDAAGLDVDAMDRIVLDEVCGAFALYTLGMFLSSGMGLSPWFFPEDEARARMQAWLDRPRLRSWCNPLWWLGLWAARAFVRKEWRTLRVRVQALREARAA